MDSIECPHCHQPIYDDEALLCHFCGGSLRRPGKGLLGQLKYGKNRIIWIGVILIVILGFCLAFIS